MQSSLKSKFISGVFYTSIAKYAGIVVSFVITAILARLISPKDFGIVAISTVFISFFATLTTVGISPAIVQNKTITDSELRSINTFTFILAIILTFLFLIAIPFILAFYNHSEQLKNVLMLLSINVFFSVASVVPNAMILKAKLFKFIAVRTFLVQFVLGALSVLCAFLGCGIYALLVNPILGSIILFIINFKKKPVGFAKIHKKAVDKIFSFSIYQFFFNLVYLCYRNIDKFFIGRFFGMSNLGYYEKSYRLMMLPLENISSVISPVLHPLLSDYQNDPKKIWNSYLKMIRLLSEFSFIASVALYFLADSIIIFLYGENWKPAIPIFKILSLSVCFQLLQSPIGAVLQSINKVKALFYGGLWMLLFVICAILLSWQWNDLQVLAIGIDVSFFAGFIMYQIYLVRYFGKSILQLAKIIIPHVLYSLILFALCAIVQYKLQPESCMSAIIIFSLLPILTFVCLMISRKNNETTILIRDVIYKIRGHK